MRGCGRTTAVNASPGDPRIRGVRKLDVCNVTAHSGKPSGQNNSGGKESQQICCVRIDPCASIWEGRTNRSQATIWNGMWPESRRVRHERDQGHVHRGHNPEKNEIHGDLACGTTHPIPANTKAVCTCMCATNEGSMCGMNVYKKSLRRKRTSHS